MRAVDILHKKRHGLALERDEIAFLVDGFTGGDIPDYQISAFLMAVTLSGMNQAETRALTETMLASGAVLDFSDIPGEKIDKHSTGGVGDKTSLIIAPLAAAAGLRVPMISGRALGHSGGTLDKLEAIPGFDVHLDEKRFKDVVGSIGCAIIGQSEEIAPADRKLYALRDVTATIESLPLITGSILSKKLAEGISGLVLDVKFVSGAFMKTTAEARALADLLVDTATHMGKKVTALLTNMNQPLGNYVGNALEVEESIAVLSGDGATDLRTLSLTLTAHMLVLGGVAADVDEGEAKAESVLASGQGLAKFHELVNAQGGNASPLPRAARQKVLEASRGGYVASIETETIGRAAMILGAGRETVDDTIDPGAGLVVHKKLGDELAPGEPLVTLHFTPNSKGESNLSEVEKLVERAYRITETPPSAGELELVHTVLTPFERKA